MTNVLIDVAEGHDRLVLKAMFEAEGFAATESMGAAMHDGNGPDLIISDDPQKAVEYAAVKPTLLLARAAQIPEAVAAMAKGVYGYIFLPLQPGEAVLMARKALGRQAATPAPGHGQESVMQAERRLIEDVLRQCKNNQTQAAKLLGIGRNTLWRKLKKFRDLQPKPRNSP